MRVNEQITMKSKKGRTGSSKQKKPEETSQGEREDHADGDSASQTERIRTSELDPYQASEGAGNILSRRM